VNGTLLNMYASDFARRSSSLGRSSVGRSSATAAPPARVRLDERGCRSLSSVLNSSCNRPAPMTFNYLTTLRTVAAHDPDRLLVASPTRRLSADRFVDEVDRLAGWLAANGVRAGQPVGIMMWNRPEFLVGFYAALAVGSPPVNVNPRYRSAEVL